MKLFDPVGHGYQGVELSLDWSIVLPLTESLSEAACPDLTMYSFYLYISYTFVLFNSSQHVSYPKN